MKDKWFRQMNDKENGPYKTGDCHPSVSQSKSMISSIMLLNFTHWKKVTLRNLLHTIHHKIDT